MVDTKLEDVLDLIGFGKMHVMIIIMGGCMSLVTGTETMGMSIIVIVSQCDLQTTVKHKALLTNMGFLGMMLSAYFWGYQSDIIGRRKILISSSSLTLIFSLLSAVMPEFWSLLIMRLLMGFALGGPAVLVLSYLCEFTPYNERTIAVVFLSFFRGICFVYVPGLAQHILKLKFRAHIFGDFYFTSWRLLMIVNSLPSLLGVILLCFLPESPKYLLSVNRHDKAFEVLNWLSRHTKGKTLEEMDVTRVLPIDMGDIDRSKGFFNVIWQYTRPLLRKPYIKNFSISCTIMFGLFCIGNGLALWFPSMRNHQATGDKQATACDLIDEIEMHAQDAVATNNTVCVAEIVSYRDPMIFGYCVIGGYIILIILLEFVHRNWIIVGSLTMSGVCGLMLNWLQQPIVVLSSFVVFIILPTLLISTLCGVVVDFIPTYLRGKALCLAVMIGRFGTVVGSDFIGILLGVSCMWTLNVLAVFVLFCAFLTILLPIDTRKSQYV